MNRPIKETEFFNFLEEHRELLVHLARLKTILISENGPKPKKAATTVVDGATVFTLLEGVVDFSKETGRLEKEIGKLAGEVDAVSRKLNNEDFLKKAPPEVVEKVKEKSLLLIERQRQLEANLNRVREAQQ